MKKILYLFAIIILVSSCSKTPSLSSLAGLIKVQETVNEMAKDDFEIDEILVFSKDEGCVGDIALLGLSLSKINPMGGNRAQKIQSYNGVISEQAIQELKRLPHGRKPDFTSLLPQIEKAISMVPAGFEYLHLASINYIALKDEDRYIFRLRVNPTDTRRHQSVLATEPKTDDTGKEEEYKYFLHILVTLKGVSYLYGE